MSVTKLIDLLGVEWSDARAHLECYTADAKTSVVRWCWCPPDAAWEDPGLLWAERDGRDPVTQTLDAPLEDPPGGIGYGFDAEGRIVLAIRNGGVGGRTDMVAVWVTAGDGRRIQLAFLIDVRELALARVAVPEYRGGRLTALRRIFDAGQRESSEAYRYDQHGRVAAIEIEHSGADGMVDREVYDIGRDADGDLLVIKLTDEEGTTVVYRRRDPSRIKVARRRVQRELAGRARSWARRCAPAEPVHCLALVYSTVDPWLPPALALGTVAERDALAPDADDVYAPAEFLLLDESPREFDDPSFQEDCQTLTQESRSREDSAEPRRLLIAVATELNKDDWTSAFEADPGFVVYAVDDELIDLERNLRAAGVRRPRP